MKVGTKPFFVGALLWVLGVCLFRGSEEQWVHFRPWHAGCAVQAPRFESNEAAHGRDIAFVGGKSTGGMILTADSLALSL